MPIKQVPISDSDRRKIFIIDDHPLVRQGISRLIDGQNDMQLVGEAGNAVDALQKIKAAKPDLAIIDISLKGTSGLDLSSALLAQYPKLMILIISMHDESFYVERVLKIGAKGYLMKDQAMAHVITAIRIVLSGEIYVSDAMKKSFVDKAISGGSILKGSSPENLSVRELEVLQLIGQGLSTRQISETLHISVKTIDSHYANIKMKMNLKNSHSLIQYAVKWSLATL